MHFVLQTPSLQNLAVLKIVTCLWNQPDIFTQISKSLNSLWDHERPEVSQEWKAIEERVRSKVSALSLFERYKWELLNVIKPIGREILTWRKYHHLDGNFFKIFDPFCWTMHGTIDYAKTAALKVKDERLSVERRFEFACLNCLEDQARELIEFIPNDRIIYKYMYITEEVDLRNRRLNVNRLLIAYFACTLSGDVDLMDRLWQVMDLRSGSLNESLFQVVLCKGSRAACEYFFQRVSQAEKEKVWFHLQLRRPQYPICGLMYSLSLVNETHVRCQRSIVVFLTHVLRWPMQPLFMETVKRAWQLIDNSDHCALVLENVLYKIHYGFEEYDYIQWFMKLWRSSPADHKHDFFDSNYRLLDLIATKRKELIQFVFNKAPAHRLKELVEDLVEKKIMYIRISAVLMNESVISDAALVECKNKAALKSSKDEDNEEKRLRSEQVSCLIDLVMERRIKRKEKLQ